MYQTHFLTNVTWNIFLTLDPDYNKLFQAVYTSSTVDPDP